MNQIYNRLDALSDKTDEELFGIYCGYSKNHTMDERYLAARILESRDFKFQEIRTYRLKWEKDKWAHRSITSKFHHHLLNFLRKISFYLLLLLFLALSVIIVAQLFLGHGKWMLSLSSDLWFFLNVLSFVALFYIFGFIGYFSRSFEKFKRKKKEFELAEDSL